VILSPPTFLNDRRHIAVAIGGTKRFAGTESLGYIEFLLTSSVVILDATDGSVVGLHHSTRALGTSLTVHGSEERVRLFASVAPVWMDVSEYLWGDKLSQACNGNQNTTGGCGGGVAVFELGAFAKHPQQGLD
jgi:hypothetical protein